jgi:dTDP-4-amino-4,6-dideoxygalactose transaminase
MGRAQLEQLPEFLTARRDNARRLSAALEDSPVVAPHEPAHVRHAYNQFTVRAEDRDRLAEHLEEAGVRTAVYYPRAIHEQPAYSHVDHRAPVAERAAEEVLSIPVHPGLSTADIETVATALEAYDA